MHDKSKIYFWILLDLLVLAVLIGTVFAGIPAASNYAASLAPARTLVVTAEGKTTVSPDLAILNFSIFSQGKSPDALTSDSNGKMAKAVDFLKSESVDAKDIQTTGYNLSPNYQYDDIHRRNYVDGYTLTQTVTVKVRDLSKVAGIVGGLTPLGVNEIGGITFTVDQPENYLGDARSEAYRTAAAKAEQMAQDAGVSLGRVVNVSESQQGMPIPYAMSAAKFAYGMGGGAAPIESGTQELKVDVAVTYEIK